MDEERIANDQEALKKSLAKNLKMMEDIRIRRYLKEKEPQEFRRCNHCCEYYPIEETRLKKYKIGNKKSHRLCIDCCHILGLNVMV
jgi:hypothetical protein